MFSSKSSRESGSFPEDKKILVAYFSHSGNTQVIAHQINKNMGGDIFEIQSVQHYPVDYNSVVEVARQELRSGYMPALRSKIDNFNQYDIIFIGYPCWWSTFPAPVKTFFSENDSSGKIIIPFCTHEGSGLGRSVSDLKNLCPKAKVLDGLAIRGSYVKMAQNDIMMWLRRLGMTR
ncbi:MAG: flavodoxin [Bacteroidota bacterium]|nr:flavodoxin [Bacteroidota bacterium]